MAAWCPEMMMTSQTAGLDRVNKQGQSLAGADLLQEAIMMRLQAGSVNTFESFSEPGSGISLGKLPSISDLGEAEGSEDDMASFSSNYTSSGSGSSLDGLDLGLPRCMLGKSKRLNPQRVGLRSEAGQEPGLFDMERFHKDFAPPGLQPPLQVPSLSEQNCFGTPLRASQFKLEDGGLSGISTQQSTPLESLRMGLEREVSQAAKVQAEQRQQLEANPTALQVAAQLQQLQLLRQQRQQHFLHQAQVAQAAQAAAAAHHNEEMLLREQEILLQQRIEKMAHQQACNKAPQQQQQQQPMPLLPQRVQLKEQPQYEAFRKQHVVPKQHDAMRKQNPPAKQQRGANLTQNMAPLGLQAQSVSFSAQLQYMEQTTEARQPDELPTTIMLRNIPNKYTQAMVIEELEGLGFKDTFDFVYCPPVKQYPRPNIGYAFVNFIHNTHLQRAIEVLHQKYAFTRFRRDAGKLVTTSIARVQGLQASIKQFQESAAVAGHPLHLPYIRVNLANQLSPSDNGPCYLKEPGSYLRQLSGSF
eukprot:TRINITY_DN7688_c0_g2_i1.p1 TRINITY_DN7688_c0_g2~~TRINITY_DN7688_c0_g2_i1.p1  ORF type:complete len:528 (+),score=168.21 TRINITY_DN7688_c0_g2_i1:95-1678(+)